MKGPRRSTKRHGAPLRLVDTVNVPAGGTEPVSGALVHARQEVQISLAHVVFHEAGQDIRAIVVGRPGADLDVEELRAFCAESLAYYKVPSHWEVRSEPLPRNATGKLLRNVLTGDAALDFVEE